MVFMLPARKCVSLASLTNHKLLLFRTFNPRFITTIPIPIPIPNKENCEADAPHSPSQYSHTFHLSPFFPDPNHSSTRYDIELVDHDAWGVSSGVAQSWRYGAVSARAISNVRHLIDEEEALDFHHVDGDLAFEEDIDNMRVRGNLFFKLERSSKEFEEYSLEFRGKKSSKKKENAKEVKKAKTMPNATSKQEKKLPRVQGRDSTFDDTVQREPLDGSKVIRRDSKSSTRQFTSTQSTAMNLDHKTDQVTRSASVIPQLDAINDIPTLNKRQRVPTFNQLTGPYHEPFCLDIYISNASVRACIVHRVTSKVVAVAHSISKDIKFDMTSTKNRTTCAAVGTILAQRALADDIHDVTYTPRKGERLEGKLQIVLQSIIDSGINVKVKIKQRHKKSFCRI